MKREQLTMWITVVGMLSAFLGALLVINGHMIGLRVIVGGLTFSLLFLIADAFVVFPYFPTEALLLGWRRRLYLWCMWNIPTAANIVAIFSDTVASDIAAAMDAESHYLQYNMIALEEAISEQNRAIEDWFTEPIRCEVCKEIFRINNVGEKICSCFLEKVKHSWYYETNGDASKYM